ncbi:L,D-transpeptidase family protein [Pseudomonas sp. 7P_10.2_Bac1]|uniref:L,D-transpeptidase family protein n=1 Tax=Pseudomonas sp. 7P_10.2_Bac1 TaxID=2971614 RepID=UPI0021C934AD|nr:L,D-transpeptidase family protein [Pseudomonas sp. 7P_10.2_Bac1]MCU1728279.1 L,D-transpeptidase family protein [Pseudomonas sp. 7P_10.2_Bac1]
MRWLLAALCLSFAVTCQAAVVMTINGKPVDKDQVLKPPQASQRTSGSQKVDKILVLKSARRLELISDGKAIRTYRISLGKQPKGPKLQEGDKRTPEGLYWVDWRKRSEKFNLAMHINYPNVTDAAAARRAGVNPGSMIMIHGTPDSAENPEELFHTLDWTDGCIAMKNYEMREVWSMVKDGTLVEIRP